MSNWFTHRLLLTIHLKSGVRIRASCDHIAVTKENGNDIASYSIRGLSNPDKLLYVRLSDVSAITTRSYIKPNLKLSNVKRLFFR